MACIIFNDVSIEHDIKYLHSLRGGINDVRGCFLSQPAEISYFFALLTSHDDEKIFLMTLEPSKSSRAAFFFCRCSSGNCSL